MNNSTPGPWDDNVESRIKELEPHDDTTYWNLLVPLFKNEIKNMALQEAKIIDVGCGLGFLTNELAAYAGKITGIDISPKSIDYAKAKFTGSNIEFKNISIIDFQKKNQGLRYDICIANMVFHNIPELDENLNAISQLLNENGYLIFTIPHPAFWYESRKFEKDSSFKYHKEKNYTVPFKIKDHDKHPSPIIYCHRSIKRYSELLTKNNFRINKQDEPYLCSDSQGSRRDEVRDIFCYICQLKQK